VGSTEARKSWRLLWGEGVTESDPRAAPRPLAWPTWMGGGGSTDRDGLQGLETPPKPGGPDSHQLAGWSGGEDAVLG